MMKTKRLKSLIRRLIRLIAGRPNRVTWREGDPDCGVRVLFGGESYRTIVHSKLWIAVRLVEAGDFFVASLMVVNGSDRSVLVNPGLSLLAVWRDDDMTQEPVEKLSPHRAWPADLFEAKRLDPKESVAGELCFRREALGAACFVMPIEGVFYQFVISPALPVGAIERRS